MSWAGIHSLHGRLTVVLVGLLVLLGGAGIVSTLLTTEMYLAEVDQSLQLDLAMKVAMAKNDLLQDGEGGLRQEGIEELFHWLMAVNPFVEFYVLDRDGRILAFDAEPGKVKSERVDLAPLSSLLRYRSGDDVGHLPILGDDPRNPGRRKIFSAAPIPLTGEPMGYLYIILGGERYESVAERLQASWVLRLSFWSGLGALVTATLLGFLVSWRLTSPLRSLAARIRAFRGDSASQDALDSVSTMESAERGDEVRQLELAFDQMSARIEMQMARIHRIEEERRELIANVSHDLRTPLASLQGYLETLSLKEESLDARQRAQYVEVALAQSERLGRMVEELFELTKLETKEVALQLEPFPIAELVQDNVQRFQLEARERGVELEADIDPELPSVRADIGLIERVLENLIENALKYTPPGGRVQVVLEEEKDRVLVRIADSGVGIPREDLPQIFDRYYQSRLKEQTGAEGAGLGLAITRRILDLHGSRIGVESEPGLGTTFVFGLSVA